MLLLNQRFAGSDASEHAFQEKYCQVTGTDSAFMFISAFALLKLKKLRIENKK